MPAPIGHPPYNVNGEGGRPRKYTLEFIDKEADLLNEWLEKPENIFIEDFCLSRKYHEQYITQWIKISQRFNDAYDTYLMKQKVVLKKGGLRKTFAYPMCALLLAHSHGIVSKTEQKITSDSNSLMSKILGEVSGTSEHLVKDGESSS